MNKKRIPDKSDIDAIRAQIMDFACSKHDFKLETENFLPEGSWKGIFVVTFRNNSKKDRLYCEAPLGEQFLRFGLELTIDKKIWDSEYENILEKVSGYDVAISLRPTKGEESKRHCSLYSRAWIPNFNQRIFGLTLSNLIDCKAAVLSILSNK